jgi:hypothetical protein
MKIYLLEKLWKPFWDNLFKYDKNILSKEIIINEDFKDNYLFKNGVPEEVFKKIVMNPINRMKQLKKKIMKYDDDLFISPENEMFESKPIF